MTTASVLAPISPLAGDPTPRAARRPAVTRRMVYLVTLAGVAAAGIGAARNPLLGAGVAGAVALGMLFALRPDLAGYTMVIIVPVVPGLRRGLPVPGLRLSEALIILAAAAVLLPRRAESPRWQAFDAAALAYVAVTCVAGVVNTQVRGPELTFSVAGAIAAPLQYLLLYRVVLVGLRSRPQREQALRIALWLAVPMAALAGLQVLNLGPVRETIISLTESEVAPGTSFALWSGGKAVRATGLFAIWHGLAGYLVVVIAVAVALLLSRHQTVMPRRWLLVVLVAAAAGIGASVTFISAIGAAIAALVLLGMAGRLRHGLPVLAAVAVLAGLLVMPQLSARLDSQLAYTSVGRRAQQGGSILPQTLSKRVSVWTDDYLPFVSQYPVTGYGPGAVAETDWAWTESQYVTFLVRGGVPLLLTFVALMGALWVRARRVARSPDPLESALARAVLALVVGLAVMNLLNPYFTDTGLSHLFWAVVGLMGAPAAALARPGAAQAALSRPAFPTEVHR